MPMMMARPGLLPQRHGALQMLGVGVCGNLRVLQVPRGLMPAHLEVLVKNFLECRRRAAEKEREKWKGKCEISFASAHHFSSFPSLDDLFLFPSGNARRLLSLTIPLPCASLPPPQLRFNPP